ncbi:hypothetical protein SAMN04487948_112119 [Halogranum amylolyticum]|uniref:Uncharacterized protein n=1 Tax=Halogranum amylolyticum TaxID=660520 RepID=A0A1H8UUJ4_9EURY|nr:hypothetical protein [Halogranum amylolyticum]SEP06647.1 hypothetical protein SAMN04487948_112119 [Halogranum amylolyticum]
MIRELRPVLVACLLVSALLVGTVHASVGGDFVRQQVTSEQPSPEDVERAHERLQQANRGYQTALATVDAADDVGVDTRPFDDRLGDAHAALTEGVEAVRQTPPNTERAIEAAAHAELLSLAVRADAEEAARRAVAEAAIDAEVARLESEEVDASAATAVWFRRARADLAAARFEAAERDLRYARHAAQRVHYESYLANLSAQGLELEALESELTTFSESIEEGSLEPGDAAQVRQSFVRTDTCVARLHEATLAIERANRTSSVLVTANVTAATEARQQGYGALERGEYDAACQYADTAIETANAETRRVRTTIADDVVARTVDVVYDALRGFVAAFDGRPSTPNTVHPPTLTLVDDDPVSVAFTPPTPSVTPLDFTAGSVDVPTPTIGDEERPSAETQPPADRATSTVATGKTVTDETERGGDEVGDGREATHTVTPTRTVERVEAASGDGEATRDTEAVEEEHVRFDIRIDRVEACGATCRDITGTLRNVGTGDAHNVEADIELSVGGTVVWTGTESVGTLPAGETRPVSQRITLGFGEALQARSSGSVDVVIVVRSDEHTQTIRDTIPI